MRLWTLSGGVEAIGWQGWRPRSIQEGGGVTGLEMPVCMDYNILEAAHPKHAETTSESVRNDRRVVRLLPPSSTVCAPTTKFSGRHMCVFLVFLWMPQVCLSSRKRFDPPLTSVFQRREIKMVWTLALLSFSLVRSSNGCAAVV